MRRSIKIGLALFFIFDISPAIAGTYIYDAVCEKSYSKQGLQSEDLSKKAGESIACNSIVLSLLENGKVIIQIVNKASRLTPLGFAGNGLDYESNQNFVTVPLERIYLPHQNNPSNSESVSGIEGFCFLDGKLNIRALKSVSCTGKIELGTQRVVYSVSARVTSIGERVSGN